MIDIFLGLVAILMGTGGVWILSSYLIDDCVEGNWFPAAYLVFGLSIFVGAIYIMSPQSHSVMVVTALAACVWGIKKYWN